MYPYIRTVYLATDYPIESITLPTSSLSSTSPVIAHSSTFTRILTPTHAAAFQHFVNTMAIETGLELTGYMAEEQKIPDYLTSLFESTKSNVDDPSAATYSNNPGQFSIGSIDPGLIAIMDKIILVRASYFLAGRDAGVQMNNSVAQAPQCGRGSSFTMQVIETRENQAQQGGKLNLVDRWDSAPAFHDGGVA
jgi:hypothetical protein